LQAISGGDTLTLPIWLTDDQFAAWTNSFTHRVDRLSEASPNERSADASSYIEGMRLELVLAAPAANDFDALSEVVMKHFLPRPLAGVRANVNANAGDIEVFTPQGEHFAEAATEIYHPLTRLKGKDFAHPQDFLLRGGIDQLYVSFRDVFEVEEVHLLFPGKRA
jgi:hypothetical protein